MPSSRSVLGVLSKARLLDLGRDLALALTASATKEAVADVLLGSGALRFRELLQAPGPR